MASFIRSFIKGLSKKNSDPVFTYLHLLSTIGSFIASKPGTQKNLEYFVEQVLNGGDEQEPEHPLAGDSVRVIIDLLDQKRVRPQRIAIDGLPGSGKSSLARILGEKLHMYVQCLDYQQIDKPISNFRNNTIYEHYRLLRTQCLDCFDLIIYMDVSVREATERLLRRKRGAFLIDIFDFQRLKRVGDRAFYMAAGKSYTFPENSVHLKFKPPGGFLDEETLTVELEKKEKFFKGLSKEQKLFLAVENRRGKGFKAYLTPKAFEHDLMSLISAYLKTGKTSGS